MPDDLATLHEAWDAALADERRLVLLTGEPGIGKSRLAAEFTRAVHADGAVVLYGRFDETGPGAYQPVMEMLRGWSGGAPLTLPAQRLGPRAADLAALLPELGVPNAPTAVPATGLNEVGTERQRLFDALAALLAELAAGAPLLLVFDDLHWADSPTVQLLRHLVRAPQPRRTMFLGTYRDAELEEGHPLPELIASLRREDGLTHVALEGLDPAEVGELIQAHGAAAPSSDLVSALHGETEGNPFFVEEVLRHLRDTQGSLEGAIDLEEAGVPEGVRGVTSRRLRRLPSSAREAVEVASVIGRQVDFGLLEALGPLTGDDLVAALDEAVRARVLREVDGRVGRYAFTHALVRATLYDGLSALRRARLHSRVGETILARHQEDLDPWLPQLARHFARAAPVDGPARAIDFALAAGRRADRLLAWEEAAAHYRGAMRARQATNGGDRTSGELLLALGASEERAGIEHARATFAEAAELARELEDPILLARAALGVAGSWSTLLGREEPEVVALLEEALQGLGEEDSPLRARLLARLSLELYYAGQPERRMLLSEASVRIARRIGDPATLAAALDARHYVLWRPENVEERLDVAAELREIAAEIGDLELELEGAGWTVVDLLELGDVEGADIQIEAAAAVAAVVHRPLYLWWTSLFRCARAQLVGRFRRRRAAGGGDARDRAARARRERPALLRDGDVQHPPRAGPARGGRGRGRELHRDVPGDPGLALLPGADAHRAGPPRRGARGVRERRGGRLRRAAAGRQLPDRRDAARRGLRRARRRRPRRPSCTRCWRRTAGATCWWGARRAATARPRGCWGSSRACSGSGRRPSGASRRRWRCTCGWAPGRGWRAPSWRGRRCCWRAASRATRPRRGRGWRRRSCSPTRSGWSRWPSAPARSWRGANPSAPAPKFREWRAPPPDTSARSAATTRRAGWASARAAASGTR